MADNMSTKLDEAIKDCLTEIGELRSAINLHKENIAYEQQAVQLCEDNITALERDVTKWKQRISEGETDKRLSDVLDVPDES